MASLKSQLEGAQLRAEQAEKRWNDAVEECSAFGAAAVAAEQIHSALDLNDGNMSQKQKDDLLKAEADLDLATAAFFDSERLVRDAKRALVAAQTLAAKLQLHYDVHTAAEEKRRENIRRRRAAEEARCAQGREAEEARQKRAQNEQKSKAEQANSERKRPEEYKRPNAPREPEMPGVEAAHEITAKEKQDWLDACSAAFADKQQLRIFPELPVQPCENEACAAEKEGRALKACKCNLHDIFKGRATLKVDRLQFHPDKFSSCPADVRAEMVQKATEVFVVVDGMFQGR